MSTVGERPESRSWPDYRWINARDIGGATLGFLAVTWGLAAGIQHFHDKACSGFAASAEGSAIISAVEEVRQSSGVEDPAPITAQVGRWVCEL